MIPNPEIISDITGGVVSSLPTIAVMWYMLQDVRTKMQSVINKVNELEIKVAADDSRVKITHIDEKLREVKSEAKVELKELQGRVLMMENQLPKIWAKVGDRPEDIKRREGI